MTPDLTRTEAHLGRDARRYLRDPNPEVKRALSSDLQSLLTELWDTGRLSEARWFDGVVDGTFQRSPRGGIGVFGLMVWGVPGNESRQWVDVFAAELRVDGDLDDSIEYTLRFGRQGQETRRVRYEQRQELRPELEQPRTWEWAFVFPRPARTS
jgi:hypothetical protein